jgi:hypothetical protein
LADAQTSLDALPDVFRDAAAAADVLRRLAEGPPDAWDSHDNTVRIAFALNSISRGTDFLLDAFIQLARTSTKAQGNVVEWATGLYRTPPPADGGPRPGLSFLRGILGEVTAVQQKRAELKEKLAQADVPTDDRFVDGVAYGHVLLLGRFLAAHSLRDYRVALDVVQHDNPGNQHGHVLYKLEGGRWAKEASCKLNYEDSLREYLLTVLDKILDDKATLGEIKSCGDIGEKFANGAKKLRESVKKVTLDGQKPFTVARQQLRIDRFYRDNRVPDPESFFKLLDSKHHLMGFNNGVLDMRSFRFHPPDDVPADAFVSLSTGRDFIGTLDCEPSTEELRAEMEEVEAMLATFFPREAVRTLMKDTLAVAAGVATLKMLQIFCILIGFIGSNGKSRFVDWVASVFGPDYAKSLDPNYLTHTGDPNKPQSGLMEIRHARVAFIHEAEQSEDGNKKKKEPLVVLNDFLKRWSGGDTFQMRDMYGYQEQVVLNAVPVLVCNTYPRFSKPEEDALVRRTNLVPLEARFVNTEAEANPDAYVYVKNMNLEATFQRLLPAFTLCLVKWGRELRARNLVLKRPYETYDEIMDYIEDATNKETDPAVAAKQETARAWLLANFAPSDPAAECPDTSTTCPKEFSKGKPRDKLETHLCPCVWTIERLRAAYKEANPALDGDVPLDGDKFNAAVRKVFLPHLHIKNRHVRVWGKSACYYVRMVHQQAMTSAGDDVYMGGAGASGDV